MNTNLGKHANEVHSAFAEVDGARGRSVHLVLILVHLVLIWYVSPLRSVIVY